MARSVLNTAPEVAAADNDADLDAHLNAAFHGLADLGHELKIKAGLVITGKSLSAYLDKHSLINRI